MKLHDFRRLLLAIVCWLLTPLCRSQHATPHVQQIQVGAIFYYDEFALELAFMRAIRHINDDEANSKFRLLPLIQRLGETDGTEVLQRSACDLIENGVAAIFGPSSKANNDIVALICNSTGIPHLQFDVEADETPVDKLNHQMSLNLYPQSLSLSKAYADVLQNYGWRKFTIVYDADDPTAMNRLQDLLQLRDVHNDVVRVRKYQRGDDYRVLWKSLRGERRIVLDCDPEYLPELLNSSSQYDLTGDFNYFFLTNLQSYAADLADLQDNDTFTMNLTSVKLQLDEAFNMDASTVDISSLYFIEPDTTPKPKTLLPDLLTDAVSLFAYAVQNLTSNARFRMPRMSCDAGENDRDRWGVGQYLYDYMKATTGIENNFFRSTNLQFAPDGQRINFNLEIFDPLDDHVYAIWDTKGQLHPLNVQKAVSKRIVYRVASRLGEPYFMEDPDAVDMNVTGNARYMGYAVDLIEALAQEIGFEYVFVPAADNQYGKYNKETKQWNGVIGEIINNDAHMGICDLTITQARKTVVDFTVPFMQLGISILAYRTPAKPNEVLAFLDPFAAEVWLNVVLAIFIVTILMIFVARISKMEWVNPHPCDKDPETLENEWGTSNTTWLTVASIMTAGCDILPRSPPMRCFNAMWWIFAIVIANSYTANLAAFLTNSAIDSSVTSLKDLVEQTEVKFGTIYGGSTYTFFGDSNETTYRLAFNIMNGNDPSAYTLTNQEGVKRVLDSEGQYMFLMETTSLEYNTERHCSLYAVGEKFGEKHYAIAVPFGAEYRSALSVGILRLSERGELFEMKNKWWKLNESSCPVSTDTSETPDMNFQELRGIFYTLGVGLLLAYVIGIVEFLIYAQDVALRERMSFKGALLKELNFVCCFWNNKKPIVATPPSSREESEEEASQTSRKKSLSVQSQNAEAHELHSLKSVKSHKSATGSVRSRVTKV